MHVRTGTLGDVPEVLRIQRQVPEASQWDPSNYELLIADFEGRIAGFLVWRPVAPDEAEILNLAVAPEFRHRGAAVLLLQALRVGNVFLEVRAGNLAARALYTKAGFIDAGIRVGYYVSPVESAIVMRRQS